MSLAASLLTVTTVAFHPYSVPAADAYVRTGLHGSAAVKGTEPAEPADGSQPGWDDVATDTAAGTDTTEPPPPTVTDTTPVPAVEPVKPGYNKGTGLMIGAGVTGGLAWVLGLTRMAFVKQCTDQLQSTSDVPTGFAAVNACAFKAGAAGAALGIVQVPLNWATWGMAGSAGAVRGRYDAVDQAWLKGEGKKATPFIGAGAALLAVGIIGRITAGVLVFRPYRNFADDLTAADTDTAAIDDAVKRLSRSIRGRLFGVQLSSATIAAGAGLLAYGIAYRKNFASETSRLQQVRFAPQFSIDRASGSAYTGFSLSARF